MSKQQLRDELDEVVATLNGKEYNDDNEYEYELGTHNSGLAIDITKGGEAQTKVTGRFCKAAMRAGYVVVATLSHVESEYHDHTRIFLHEAEEHFDLADEEEWHTLPLGKDDALLFARGESQTFDAVDGTPIRVDTTMDPDGDRLEEELDDARLEGFGAGLLFGATMVGLEALYPRVEAEEMVEELEALEGDEETQLEPLNNGTAIKEIERLNEDLFTGGRLGAVIDAHDGVDDAHDGVEGELYVYAFEDSIEPSDFETPKGWKAIDDDGGIGFVELSDNEVAIKEIERLNSGLLRECASVVEAPFEDEDYLSVATPEHVTPNDFNTPNGWVARDGYHGVRFERQ